MARVLAIAAVLVALTPAAVLAQHTGVVFDDANASGIRDSGEAGRAGVAVTNGRDVAVTGADGRYELADRGAGFLSVTCPSDGRCPVWFHSAGGNGDFPVVPAASADDFFFIQMSDVHAYPKVEDVAGLLPKDGLPWWLPRNLVGWFLLRSLDEMYPYAREEIVGYLRDVVARHRNVDGTWDSTVMMDYVELVLDPATGLVQPAIAIPHAFAEINALAPDFVINTGDLIFEGNSGDADSVERWYSYYLQLAADSGLTIYETIGNNELAGTDNRDFPPSDPRYGKALFRKHFGPTHYSFDRGSFHFAALDTHRREFEEGEREDWSFNDMEPAVRDWLDADLAAAHGRVHVVLNHEPFHEDPSWNFDGDFEPANDQGLFQKHGVSYVLAGHIHRNGFEDAPPGGGVTQITTGALSGFRWMLPTPFDSHGYRLFYAHERRLYSAWKEVDQPLLGFVDPVGDAAIHPASTHSSRHGANLEGAPEHLSVVAVAADVARPFAFVELLLDGERLTTSRWGDYFVHARVPIHRISRPGASLVLKATRADGRTYEARLESPQSAAR